MYYTVPKIVSIKLTNKPNIFDNHIRVSIPHLKQEIPIFILFRALGCISDKEIIYYIINNDNSDVDTTILKILKNSILEAIDINTEAEAIEYMSNNINTNGNYTTQSADKKIKYIREVVIKDYLIHLNDVKSKIFYTGYMVNSLIKCYLGIKPPDDRDSFINKRVDTCGALIGNLFISVWIKLQKISKTSTKKLIMDYGISIKITMI